ncbi:MAG: HupE/UreJ family protein [Chitinophagaceae bacterium]|nr:HupE/UreJ family protein [Chitinophagaceae bacterium]
MQKKKGNTIGKTAVMLFSFSLMTMPAFAHTINYALEKAPAGEVAWYYAKLGFTHIIPEGLDHILFVAGLCLLSARLKTIVWQATAFTIAHSITLAMSMKGFIVAPPAIVEPIIALSILFIAIENLIFNQLKPWRIVLVFLFGLIHGMGFASSLNEIGLPPGQFLTSILYFNIGVELGQVTVITVMFLLLIIPFRGNVHYRKYVVYPLSILIGMMAMWWTVERVLLQ